MVGVARPLRVVFLRGDESEEPTVDVARSPRVCEAICVRFWIWWYHSVEWCVMLQWHFGKGSRMVVTFSVRCSLFLSIPINTGHA